MNNNSYIAGEFLSYINKNYHPILRGFQKSSFKKEIDDDVYHDSILSIHNSILDKGFKFQKNILSGKCFENILFVVCCNAILQKKRLIKTKGYNLSFDSDEVFNNYSYLNADFEYNFEDEIQVEKEKIAEDILISEIRRFINKKHDQLDVGIFEFYFRSGLSLQKIGELTGYSTRTIFLKVNKVKASVIAEFGGDRLTHRLIIKEEVDKIKFKKVKKEFIEDFWDENKKQKKDGKGI